NLFCAQPGLFYIHPGIERTFRRGAAEAWDTIQVACELFTPPRELLSHALGCILRIAQGLNSAVLSKFRSTGVAVDRKHLKCIHDRRWCDGITEPPSRHSKTL